MYNVAGMTDKNKDALIKDLLDLVGSSGNRFFQALFPDRPDPNSKKRPPTAGDKIKTSAGALVDNLMRAGRLISIPSNQTRIALQLNATPKPSYIRSSTSVCRRISVFDELVRLP